MFIIRTDLLLSTIEKLSYLDIKEEKLGLTTYELNTCLGAPTRKGSSFRNLDSFAAIEELKMSSALYTWIISNPVTKLFFDTKAKTSKGLKKSLRKYTHCFFRLQEQDIFIQQSSGAPIL